MNNPLITIVTVCYNSEKTIRDTIESVLNQTYNNIEYILVDGASTDSTVEVIKSYEEKAKDKGIIYRWISEPDKGIYDAMNKGIDMANGEWINFMNSGDKFLNSSIVHSIYYNKHYKNVVVVYGDVECDYVEFKKIRKAKKLDKLKKGMIFCHQSSFIRSSNIKAIKYDTRFKLASDYDFFMKIYKQGVLFSYVNQTISSIEVGGVSDSNRKIVWKEYSEIQRLSGCECVVSKFFEKEKYFYLIKKIIPNRLVKIIVRIKK